MRVRWRLAIKQFFAEPVFHGTVVEVAAFNAHHGLGRLRKANSWSRIDVSLANLSAADFATTPTIAQNPPLDANGRRGFSLRQGDPVLVE